MKTFFAYLIAGIGLIGMALGSTVGKTMFPALAVIPKEYILYPSLILVGFGVIILIVNSKSSNKIHHAEQEVPIYQGVGKQRKIVGYRVEE